TKPWPPSSSTRTVEVAPRTVNMKLGFFVSLLAELRDLLSFPTRRSSDLALKEVDALGASVVAPKPEARLNPVGTVMAPRVRLAGPAVHTCKLCASGAPGLGVPKYTWLVPSDSVAWLDVTRIAGPDTAAPR